jgi:hypothetical protein
MMDGPEESPLNFFGALRTEEMLLHFIGSEWFGSSHVGDKSASRTNGIPEIHVSDMPVLEEMIFDGVAGQPSTIPNSGHILGSLVCRGHMRRR